MAEIGSEKVTEATTPARLLPPVLSIVLGTYNRLDQLRACVESIERETTIPYRLYITDAGSTDGTRQYLKSIKSKTIKPILVGMKLGQARAYNDVFDIVTTPYVCWLSDDNVIVNQGLDVAVRILQQHPRMGMVGLKVRDLEGPFVDAPYGGGISTIGIMNINQGVLPTHVLQSLKGFSETFRFYGIDPDLTARVLFSGWDIALTKQVAIHHYRNWTTDRKSPDWKKMKETQRRAVALYGAKYCTLQFTSVRYAAKRRFWTKMQTIWPKRLYINEQKPFLGRLPRDLYNVFNGRYISLLDPLFSRGCEHYLVQHCPKRLLPAALPPEPPPFVDENSAAPAPDASIDRDERLKLAAAVGRAALLQTRLDEVCAQLNAERKLKEAIEVKSRKRVWKDAQKIAELERRLAGEPATADNA